MSSKIIFIGAMWVARKLQVSSWAMVIEDKLYRLMWLTNHRHGCSHLTAFLSLTWFQIRCELTASKNSLKFIRHTLWKFLKITLIILIPWTFYPCTLIPWNFSKNITMIVRHLLLAYINDAYEIFSCSHMTTVWHVCQYLLIQWPNKWRMIKK